jgi:hypothetical protein
MINLELYTKYSHRPKYDAQYNLRNRAHYVDDKHIRGHLAYEQKIANWESEGRFDKIN